MQSSGFVMSRIFMRRYAPVARLKSTRTAIILFAPISHQNANIYVDCHKWNALLFHRFEIAFSFRIYCRHLFGSLFICNDFFFVYSSFFVFVLWPRRRTFYCRRIVSFVDFRSLRFSPTAIHIVLMRLRSMKARQLLNA